MSTGFTNNYDETNQNDCVCLIVNENNEKKSQSSEKTKPLSDVLNNKKLKKQNIDNSEYFGNEIENYENILITLKTYRIINKVFKSNENIEEKGDIDLSMFLYAFNKILNQIVKARETSNKLYEKQKEMENLILIPRMLTKKI